MRILLILLISTTSLWQSANGATNFSLRFSPSALVDLFQGSSSFIAVNLTFIDDEFSQPPSVRLSIGNSNEKTAKISSPQDALTFVERTADDGFVYFGNYSVSGDFFGRTILDFVVELETTDPFDKKIWSNFTIEKTYEIIVLRSEGRLQPIFSLVLSIMVAINTFVMGMQLDWRVILGIIKKPVAPFLGFLCQFGFMPVIAFSLGQLLLAGYPNLQFGLFCVGCAPGGGNSNFWTILLGGNVNLSVTMTFLSTIAALGMMPMWLYTLGAYITKGSQIGAIPFDKILISLATLIIPCTAGIILKHFVPSIEEKSKKVVKIFSLLIILVAVSFGIYVNYFIFFIIDWKSIVCGFLLPWCGFAIAFSIATICRQSRQNALTVCIETGIQNASIAIILITFSLKQPECDQTMVMPICVFLLTPIPLAILLLAKTIYERVKKKYEPAPTSDGEIVMDGVELKEKAEIVE